MSASESSARAQRRTDGLAADSLACAAARTAKNISAACAVKAQLRAIILPRRSKERLLKSIYTASNHDKIRISVDNGLNRRTSKALACCCSDWLRQVLSDLVSH